VRLLHVVASYLPAVRYGGTIVSVHHLCRALAARGHEVHVYTTSVDGPADSDVPHGRPVDRDGVKVWYFRSTHLRRVYWAPAMATALAEYVHQFDAVHTHAIYLWPLWAAARAARRAKVPYVVSPRGMLERDLVSETNPLLKGLWIAAIERHNLERASALHVTSAREAEEAGAFGFRLPAIHQIPNGVDAEVDAAGAASPDIAAVIAGEPYILFLGRVNWKKGLDRLLGALAHVPHARLVIAGNDEDHYRPVLENVAAACGVSSRVIYTGGVGGADKAALLRHAQLLVLPSYSENFGNVVLEAMAAACAVVVTPEVGVAPVVAEAEAGEVVDGDHLVLGRALATLLADPQRRREMGRRGAAAVRDRFSWDAVAADMESLYRTVIEDGAVHA
jgi:glycosyltransferase involved in cell wall biosynthesis